MAIFTHAEHLRARSEFSNEIDALISKFSNGVEAIDSEILEQDAQSVFEAYRSDGAGREEIDDLDSVVDENSSAFHAS